MCFSLHLTRAAVVPGPSVAHARALVAFCVCLKQQTSLRQANKLWLSDPIHFRKALTVPLEACTKKPAQEVLVEAHIQLDRRLICIGSCPSQPACASGQSESEEAEQLAAMAAARLVDFPDRRSSTNGSTGTSSRGSSFDLHRINPLSLHHQQNKSEEIQVSGAERFLPSTNNIYASDQVDAFEPSSEAVAPPEHARAASEEAPSFSASQAATPDVVERTYKLVEIKLSGPTPSQHDIKGKSRPTLSNDPYASSRTRKLSFRLDEQLASPPPPRPVAPSASSSSTTLRPHNPPEALALSRRRARDDQLGSGGWDAMSVEELDMAKDIVRQVNASSPERDRSGRGHKRKDSRNRTVYQPSVSSNSSTRRGQAGSGTGRGWPGFSDISDILTDWVSP